MSDGKRFQKTFARRKKACTDAEDQLQAVAEEDASVEEEAPLAPSSSDGSQVNGSDGDREVPREPFANGGSSSSSVRKSEMKKTESNGGGGGSVARKQKPKQKRKGGEEQSQQRKQKKQMKDELKMKPKQKLEGKKQIGKDGNKKKKKDEEENGDDSAGCRFPVARVDRIIRSEGSDFRITHEAVFLINKASEKFLEIFCRGSYSCAEQDRKNYVSYNHLSAAVSKEVRFDFLSDYVPEKVKAEKALAEQKAVEK